MFLTGPRSRWQARIFSLLGRSPQTASVVVDDRLLTQNETASMLQPHMRNRNALAWLELDRNLDPSLPFISEPSAIFYRLVDVRAFVRRLPLSSDSNERRGRERAFSDRRSGDDRRMGELLHVPEERRMIIDRRSGFERRNGPDRRETRDDFGYGRNGDRRGLAGKL